MLVAMRFAVPEAEADGFTERAGVALAALAVRPGYVRGELGRAYDDPTSWCLVNVWDSVCSYRRAQGAYEVKLHATPLLAQALDEPSAFEPLVTATPDGTVTVVDSDRADSPLRSRA